MRQLRALCAALLATVRSVGAQLAPQEDPAAFINELDLQQGTEHVYLELAIRKHGFHPAVFDVDPGTLRVQFFSAGRSSFSATAAPVLPVTTEAGRTCSSSSYPEEWCVGTDDELNAIRWIYLPRGNAWTGAGDNPVLPGAGQAASLDFAVALCSGDGAQAVLLDFVGYGATARLAAAALPYYDQFGHATAGCGVGAVANLAEATYPGIDPVSIGRYGTGNRAPAFVWGGFLHITKGRLNVGPCNNAQGVRMPVCREIWDEPELAAPSPPPGPSAGQPSPPAQSSACEGHYPVCGEQCADVSYVYDNQPCEGSPRDERGNPIRNGARKVCQYGDGQCRAPGCEMTEAPRGGQIGMCSGPHLPDGQGCTMQCAPDFYRQPSVGPQCDCSAFANLSPSCTRAWTNAAATQLCPATDSCVFAWPSGYSNGDGYCHPLTQCHPDVQYEASPPMQVAGVGYTSDRVCLPYTTCNLATEYEVVPATPSQNRQCQRLRVCSPSEYQARPPAGHDPMEPNYDPTKPATGDRLCLPLTPPCRSGQYESATPAQAQGVGYVSYLSNRECSLCSVCRQDQYARVPCTTDRDTDCAPLTVCPAGQLEAAAPERDANGQAITNRHCTTDAASCASNQYESVEELAVGYVGAGNVWVDAHQRACAELRVCTAHEYQATAPTECRSIQRTTPSRFCEDRVCNPLDTCQQGRYQDQPLRQCADGSGNCGNRHCALWRAPCMAQRRPSGDYEGDFQAVAPTSLVNRVCQPIRQCLQGQWAPPLQPGDMNQIMTDRDCRVWSTCQPGQYELHPGPSETTDRQCADWTECGPNEFESHAPSALENRHCQPVAPICLPLGVKYEAQAPTRTSNRVCRAVTQRCPANTWQAAKPTLTSDRDCRPVQSCDGKVEVAPPTATSDRQCGTASASLGGSDDDDGSGGMIAAAAILLLGGGGAGGAAYHVQRKRKVDALLPKVQPEEIELDDFK